MRHKLPLLIVATFTTKTFKYFQLLFHHLSYNLFFIYSKWILLQLSIMNAWLQVTTGVEFNCMAAMHGEHHVLLHILPTPSGEWQAESTIERAAVSIPIHPASYWMFSVSSKLVFPTKFPWSILQNYQIPCSRVVSPTPKQQHRSEIRMHARSHDSKSYTCETYHAY